jgi:hypothetical protein
MGQGGRKRARVAGAARLLARDPGELYQATVDQIHRAADRRRPRPTWTPRPLVTIAGQLGSVLGSEVTPFLDEAGLSEIDAEVRERVDRLAGAAPFPIAHNAAPSLALVCYALVRALMPAVVLETGVAYGVSSSFILKAMALNGAGELHSVDRPPIRAGVENYIGALVPDELRSRWTLHPGTSRRLLPRLLSEIGPPSLFVHDSQHTYRNVTWELRTVSPRLTPTAAVVVDDAAGTRAFEDWANVARPAFSAVVAEEPVGVALICGEN